MQNWLGGTYSSSAPVTPSDTTRINCRAILVEGAAGNIVFTTGPIGAPTGPVTIPVLAGALINLELNEGLINAATTATNLVGFA